MRIPSLHLIKYQRQIAFGLMSKEPRKHFITCYTTEIVFAIFEKNLELKTIFGRNQGEPVTNWRFGIGVQQDEG